MAIKKNPDDASLQWHSYSEGILPNTNHIIVSWADWQQSQDRLQQWKQQNPQRQLALTVPLEIALDDIGEVASNFQLIVIEIDLFTDGRGFSLAQGLREQYEFTGELRAEGDFLPDQVAFLHRCGFDSFAANGGRETDNSKPYFSHYYQPDGGVDPPSYIRAARLTCHSTHQHK